MNRETTFHTSDTLVVTDRSSRRRWVIIGAVVVDSRPHRGGRGLRAQRRQGGFRSKPGGKGAGQIPTVTVIVPGQTQVGRVVSASGPLAAKRDQPIGIAGQGGRVIRVLVDAGSWVRAGQVLAVVDRSVQAEQAAQLAAQIEAARANAALAQSNYERAIALQGRGFVSKAEIDAKKAARDAAYAQVRVAQATLGATRAQIGQLNVIAPAAGPDPRPQRRGRADRQPGIGRAVPPRRGRPDGNARPARAAGPCLRSRWYAGAGHSGGLADEHNRHRYGRLRRSSIRNRGWGRCGSRSPIRPT